MTNYPPAVARGPLRQARLGGWIGALLAVAAVTLASAAAPAGAADDVTVTASVDGTSLGAATEKHPIRLTPRRPAQVSFAVTNSGPTPLEVRRVRLSGRVMGLTFFAYDTSLVLTVPPGGTESRQYALDLTDLDGQATGLVIGALSVQDAPGTELGRVATVFDVRGSIRSVYGVFGLVVAGMTLLSFAVGLIALTRHTLPDNRWKRALRFLVPGIGLGLTIVFTLSALRVFVPRTGRWLPILLICAVVFFALGYLTPSPDDEAEWDESEGAPLAVDR